MLYSLDIARPTLRTLCNHFGLEIPGPEVEIFDKSTVDEVRDLLRDLVDERVEELRPSIELAEKVACLEAHKRSRFRKIDHLTVAVGETRRDVMDNERARTVLMKADRTDGVRCFYLAQDQGKGKGVFRPRFSDQEVEFYEGTSKDDTVKKALDRLYQVQAAEMLEQMGILSHTQADLASRGPIEFNYALWSAGGAQSLPLFMVRILNKKKTQGSSEGRNGAIPPPFR